MDQVIQYHHSITSADAIGTSIRLLHGNLNSSGIESHVFSRDTINQNLDFYVKPVGMLFDRGSQSILFGSKSCILVHFSFYDETVFKIAQLPVKKILVYHNVTPGRFFRERGLSDLANACDEGRRQLSKLSSSFEAAVGDSNYNSRELVQANFKNVNTIPVLLDIDAFQNQLSLQLSPVDRRTAEQIKTLFVGRIVPNKKIERLFDVIKQFTESFCDSIVLNIAGKIWDYNYYIALLKLANDLGIAENVKFHINISLQQLSQLYSEAEVFICMSDHEGFMVPIVEAFAAGCPVIGLNMAAVGETMGPAGLLVNRPDAKLTAGLIYALHTNIDLREKIIIGQATRALDFLPGRTTYKWIKKIKSLYE